MDYFGQASFGGREGSSMQITSLRLTRFQVDWVRITFLGEAETATNASIKS